MGVESHFLNLLSYFLSTESLEPIEMEGLLTFLFISAVSMISIEFWVEPLPAGTTILSM